MDLLESAFSAVKSCNSAGATSSGLHVRLTDGRLQSKRVCSSLLRGFSLKQSLSACPRLCRALDWLVGGRLRGLLFWLMTEISRGFCSQQLTYISLKQRAIPTFHPVILMSNPGGAIQITQVHWCFRTFFFFFFIFTGSGDGRLVPISHSLSCVLMPLKVWHGALIGRKKNRNFVPSPRSQMVRRENRLDSALLRFSQPLLTTNPSGCQKKKKKILNRYLISSCGIWKQRVRFIFHFYRDRRSRRTVRAVSYSSRSETQARGEKSDILVTSSACLEQDLAPLPSPSVLFAQEMLLL